MAGRNGRLVFPEIRRRLRGEPHGTLGDLIAEIIVLVLAGVGVLYIADVDGLDFITIWPPWAWAALSIIIVLALSKYLEKKRTVIGVLLAIIMGLVLSEETRFLLRTLWHNPEQAIASAADQSRLLNVMSVNSKLGGTEPIRDALDLDPDMILIQESPEISVLREMLPDGWECSAWEDCAVVVKGRVYADEQPGHLKDKIHVVQVRPSRIGRPLTAMSVHMVLPPVWNEVWGKEQWKSARRLRTVRAETIEWVLDQRDRYGEDQPIVIGGDFNVPAGHWLIDPLISNGLSDAFYEVGYGWPNTIPASFPLERIDFIWTCSRITPLSARILYTPHSDHRMVRAQLRIQE